MTDAHDDDAALLDGASWVVTAIRPLPGRLDPEWSNTTLRTILAMPPVKRRSRPKRGLLAGGLVVAMIAGGGVAYATGVLPGNSPDHHDSVGVVADDKKLDRVHQQLKEQGKEQAKQMLIAQAELAKETDKLTKGQEHELRVTIRDERPYDAYKPGTRAGECVRASATTAKLMVSDASGKHPIDLADPRIPSTARLTATGACEATMTVRVRNASLYGLDVVIEGHGTSHPTDPAETHVNSANSSQPVVVPR